ncbi:MAG TPA: flagellar biosynthetic protein FliR [Terriglobales bacterium]|jgi:flagellar biosynthetic protein FliR
MSSDLFHLQAVLAVALFVGVRVSGILVFAPFVGGTAIPMSVKAGLAVAITALLYPAYSPVGAFPSPFQMAANIISEFTVGLLLGLTLQFVLDAAQLAGQVLGVQMGFSLVNIIDPQTQVDTPVLSIFHELVTLFLFLQLNVHHWLLRGLARSFTYLPVGALIPNLASTGLLLQSAGGLFLVGVQVAGPALVATFLADIMLGFLGKASPNLPVLFLGLSVKSVLGLIVLIGSVAAWPGILEKHFAEAIVLGERLLHLAR